MKEFGQKLLNILKIVGLFLLDYILMILKLILPFVTCFDYVKRKIKELYYLKKDNRPLAITLTVLYTLAMFIFQHFMCWFLLWEEKYTVRQRNMFIYSVLVTLTLIFTVPILLILMNSFKGNLFISRRFFEFPDAETFVFFNNFINGIVETDFWKPCLYSLIITVGSVSLILVCTSMTAWFITRVKNKFTKVLYYIFTFSMIVPFQMVMFTLTSVVTRIYLNNPVGIWVVYLGFGAGLSVFMFAGFIKSIPIEIEEAATIDGCNPIQTFFLIVVPVLKSTIITVAILNVMWIWNDYLLPYLILFGTKYSTIPVAVQSFMGNYGNVNYGYFMAMLTIAIAPIIIFYVCCQKYIIKGVTAGAVKG